jgi:hypothetical protein
MGCLFAFAIAGAGYTAYINATGAEPVKNISRKIRLGCDSGGEFWRHGDILLGKQRA